MLRPATVLDWKWGEVCATSILNDLQNWAAGWTDWNVLLDERQWVDGRAAKAKGPAHSILTLSWQEQTTGSRKQMDHCPHRMHQ